MIITAMVLTSLVGGNIYGNMLRGVWTLIADTIDRLYLEAVDCVSQQVADEHPGLSQTQLSGNKLHVVVAVGTGPPVGLALLAHYVVDDVIATARLPGRMPLQDHGGLIDDGDHISRAGRNACRYKKKKRILQKRNLTVSMRSCQHP